MFSKPIFKQCVRSNGKLWGIFTLVSCFMMYFIMWSFDASAFSNIASAATGTKFEGVVANFSSFLGSLESYYVMLAVLLGMVYVIIASSNLIVSEVDSGSMAYTLSTPTRRSTVVLTKMAYMIGSVLLMFAVLTGVGLGCAELTQHCISGSAITADVKAAAEALGRKESYVQRHLYIIQDDQYALESGAEARGMDREAYSLYLDQAMLRDSYQAAAKELTAERKDEYRDSDDEDIDDDFIEITRQELEADPALMLGSSDALAAGAAHLDMTVTDYKAYIQELAGGSPGTALAGENAEQAPADGDAAATAAPEAVEPEDPDLNAIFSTALEAAAKELGTDTQSLSENLIWMKDKDALAAEAAATGLDEEALRSLIDQAMVSAALSEDNSVDFDVEAFVWLNIGCCLLILAFSAIGFFASCAFNRSKNAMVVGAGLPFVFYLFSIMVQMGDNLENFKYLTITTLYDTSEIIAMGDFGWGLGILAAITVVLYAAGSAVFCKKDLPL